MNRSRRTRSIDPRRAANSREQIVATSAGAEPAPAATAPPITPATHHQPHTPARLAGLDLHTLRLATNLLGSLRTIVATLAGTASPVSRGMRRLQGRDRRLQVTETVQLGEKRFVALLRVDGEQFLISGGTAGVSLLATLAPATTSAEPVQVVSPAAESATPAGPATFPELLTAARLRGELA